jgi:hypothetical protein
MVTTRGALHATQADILVAYRASLMTCGYLEILAGFKTLARQELMTSTRRASSSASFPPVKYMQNVHVAFLPHAHYHFSWTVINTPNRIVPRSITSSICERTLPTTILRIHCQEPVPVLPCDISKPESPASS